MVGVTEPNLVPTLWVTTHPGDCADPWKFNLADLLAGVQVVNRDLGNRMRRPGDEHDGALEFGAIEDRVTLKNRVGSLTNQVPPVSHPQILWVSNTNPSTLCVKVGVDVGATVAADVDPSSCIDANLDRRQPWLCRFAGRQVGNPQIVSWRGALAGTERQPTSIAAHCDAKVLGWFSALTKDQNIVGRVIANGVQPDATVELFLSMGDLIGR